VRPDERRTGYGHLPRPTGRDMRNARQTHVMNRARELAQSGKHRNCLSIVWQIRREGYPEAPDCLGGESDRAELERICARAQKGFLP
jgi:hypothetical protein